MIDTSKIFCEIIADDIADPLNNSFHAVENIQNERPGKWHKDILTYTIIRATYDVEKLNQLKSAVNVFMTMWDIEINPTLIPSNDPNSDIRLYWRSSSEEQYFKDKPSVLAVAYYPEQGEVSGIIIFNDDYFFNLTGDEVDAYLVDPIHYTKGDGKKIRGYNLLAIGGHELGHTLGLTHSTKTGSDDLMLPYYNPKVIWISLNDIARVLLKYPAQSMKGLWYNSRMRAWVRARLLRYQIKKGNVG